MGKQFERFHSKQIKPDLKTHFLHLLFLCTWAERQTSVDSEEINESCSPEQIQRGPEELWLYCTSGELGFVFTSHRDILDICFLPK